MWRQSQVLANFFWRRFTKEYLPSLTERKKWKEKKRSLKDGDVVLVAEPNLPRGVWPLGRIMSTHPGQDGLVREVQETNYKPLFIRGSGKVGLLIVSTNIGSRIGAGKSLPLPENLLRTGLLG